MWKKFLECLGKIGQSIKAIFKKPEKTIDKEEALRKEIESILENTNWNKVSKNLEIELKLDDSKYDKEMLEKISSMFYPILPRRYLVKTLILTLAANQQCDYQCVDMSQYEEKGIAHFIIGSTMSTEELKRAYPVEDEDEEVWIDNTASSVLFNVDLLHYEEFELWELDWDSL
jgi:hypothetical protein